MYMDTRHKFQVRLLVIIALLQNLVYALCLSSVPTKWNCRSVFRYLKQVTSNKIQAIQGLQIPVNSCIYAGKGSA